MSVQAFVFVLEHSTAERGDRLVLLSIANHADRQGGSSFPDIQTICLETRMSRSAVLRSIKSLEARGDILVTRSGGGRGRPNVYVIVGMQAAEGLVGSDGRAATCGKPCGKPCGEPVDISKKGVRKGVRKGVIFDACNEEQLEHLEPDLFNISQTQTQNPNQTHRIDAIRHIREMTRSLAEIQDLEG